MIGAYYYDRCIGERTTQHNTIKKKKKKKKKKRNVYTCVCLHSTFNDGHDPSGCGRHRSAVRLVVVGD
jgi:hypothetical protein